MSLETREIKHFGRDIPDFAGISRRCPKSLRKKSLCSILVPYFLKCGPRGGTQGAEPDSVVQRFWGPFRLRGLGIRPLVSAIRGLGNGRLEPRKGSRPERLFRGLGEVSSFSTERGNKVGP